MQLQVRTHSISEIVTMRDLNPENIDQLIAVSGMVIYTSQIIPDPKAGFFQCSICRSETSLVLHFELELWDD